MENSAKKRKVGFLLGIGIFFIPGIFAWFLLRNGHSSKARIIGFAWFLFIAMIYVAGNNSSSARKRQMATFEETSTVQKSLPAASAEKKVPSVSADAVALIDRRKSKKIYKDWGAAKVEEINQLMTQGAWLVAESERCNEVISMSLYEEYSSPPSAIYFLADCANSERYFVSAKQIRGKEKITSAFEDASNMTDSSLISYCQDKIREQLKMPSTFSASMFGKSVFRNKFGRSVVSIQFEAKNGMGLDLPHLGKCFFDGSFYKTIEISLR